MPQESSSRFSNTFHHIFSSYTNQASTRHQYIVLMQSTHTIQFNHHQIQVLNQKPSRSAWSLEAVRAAPSSNGIESHARCWRCQLSLKPRFSLLFSRGFWIATLNIDFRKNWSPTTLEGSSSGSGLGSASGSGYGSSSLPGAHMPHTHTHTHPFSLPSSFARLTLARRELSFHLSLPCWVTAFHSAPGMDERSGQNKWISLFIYLFISFMCICCTSSRFIWAAWGRGCNSEVECSLRMWEDPGSIPGTSTLFLFLAPGRCRTRESALQTRRKNDQTRRGWRNMGTPSIQLFLLTTKKAPEWVLLTTLQSQIPNFGDIGCFLGAQIRGWGRCRRHFTP